MINLKQLDDGSMGMEGATAGGSGGFIPVSFNYNVPAIVVAWKFMPELGFTPRPLVLRELPAEMKRVMVEGLRYGMSHQVVRPLMFVSFVTYSFSMFGFYSWQRYFLDLLGRDVSQGRGFDAAFANFLALCAKSRDCAFHGGGDPVAAYDALIAKLPHSASGIALDAGQAVMGVANWLRGSDFAGLAAALATRNFAAGCRWSSGIR